MSHGKLGAQQCETVNFASNVHRVPGLIFLPAQHFSMAPRNTDYGNRELKPDFDYSLVQERVAGFLTDHRKTRRGGAGLGEPTLLLRRLRSAIRTIHEALKKYPNMSAIQFSWIWWMLRKQIVRVPPSPTPKH